MATLGAFVKNRRCAVMHSQRSLAEASGVSLGIIRRIEQGQCVPTFDIIVRLAYALDVTLAELAACDDIHPDPIPPKPDADHSGRDHVIGKSDRIWRNVRRGRSRRGGTQK